MSRHGPDPERLLLGAVVSTAQRLAIQQGNIDDAIRELRRAAVNRDELLTQAAGVGVGSWSTNPGAPSDLLAASLLAASIQGIQLDVVTRWIAEGQRRATSSFRYRA